MLKKKDFGDREFFRSLIRLGLPIALQNLLLSSLSVIDTIMVGQLGEVDISAVGMASQLSMLINMFLFGITSGASVFFAQYWGAGNSKGIKRTYGLAMLLAVVVSAAFFVFTLFFPETAMSIYTDDAEVIKHGAEYLEIAAYSYIPTALNIVFGSLLRSVERPKLPMLASGLSVVVNMSLNYCLIFGKFGFPEMGVRGAAVATVVSAFVSFFTIIIVSAAEKNIVISRFREMFAFDKAFIRKYFVVALPVFANEVLWSLGVTGYNMIFGRMGVSNYSALTITRIIQDLFFVFFIGMCNCCQVLIGKSIGEGKNEEAKTTAKRFLRLTPVMGLITGGLIIVTRAPLISLFDITDAAKATAAILLLIYGIESCIRYIPYIAVVGIFRAGGDTKHGMFIDLFSLWCMGLPITALSANVFHLDFLACFIIMLLAEDILKVVLTFGWFNKDKWIMPIDDFGE